ncbi:hypothetical protein AAFF_G00419620 [Aldrovandia affinis]|uniref:Uncharacterized protein n=1 Tax=Aldrovandia affinis TaxID=143900 RepID=A0AAD7SA49_9TELE|nr:hypothetical protein AAFF_G00419620 [Aldrovandia affinis]
MERMAEGRQGCTGKGEGVSWPWGWVFLKNVTAGRRGAHLNNRDGMNEACWGGEGRGGEGRKRAEATPHCAVISGYCLTGEKCTASAAAREPGFSSGPFRLCSSQLPGLTPAAPPLREPAGRSEENLSLPRDVAVGIDDRRCPGDPSNCRRKETVNGTVVSLRPSEHRQHPDPSLPVSPSRRARAAD